MVKSPSIFIDHILLEIAILQTIPQRYSFQQFKSDPLIFRGAIYAVQVISEASRHLPTELTALYPHMRWREIRAVGNVTRHEYANLQAALIWEIITIHAPVLSEVMFDMKKYEQS